MKKIIFIFISLFLLTGCTEQRLKWTAIDYIEEFSPDADIEVTNIIKDTVPPNYLNFFLSSKLLNIDSKLLMIRLDKNNSKESNNLWNDFFESVLELQNDPLCKFSGMSDKHIVFLKSRKKDSSNFVKHIVIIDSNNIGKVEHHFFYNDVCKDIEKLVVFSRIPIDLYQKGKFGRNDYIKWLEDNYQDLINTTDSIINDLDKNFN